jgi:SAM-dependent methyltransferase
MSFAVGADAYGRFMGRYSEPLAVAFVRLLDLRLDQHAIDVGCGPGAMTAQLVAALGPASVAAVDPSESFVAAARSRFPGVDVRRSPAEELPFGDGVFDCAVAQLVVHFMTDPVAGLSEMRRVTRAGGRVAACVWDHAAGGGPLALFWRAVNSIDDGAYDESGFAGAREGHLGELFALAGLHEIESTSLSVRVRYDSFEQWWEPYTLGVGPAGAYVDRLDTAGRDALRAQCLTLAPAAPFEITAVAWAALGRV